MQQIWETRFDPWVGNIPGGGHGNPLQYSCLENPMDRRAWWAAFHRVTKSQTWFNMHTCMLNKTHSEKMGDMKWPSQTVQQYSLYPISLIQYNYYYLNGNDQEARENRKLVAVSPLCRREPLSFRVLAFALRRETWDEPLLSNEW